MHGIKIIKITTVVPNLKLLPLVHKEQGQLPIGMYRKSPRIVPTGDSKLHQDQGNAISNINAAVVRQLHNQYTKRQPCPSVLSHGCRYCTFSCCPCLHKTCYFSPPHLFPCFMSLPLPPSLDCQYHGNPLENNMQKALEAYIAEGCPHHVCKTGWYGSSRFAAAFKFLSTAQSI